MKPVAAARASAAGALGLGGSMGLNRKLPRLGEMMKPRRTGCGWMERCLWRKLGSAMRRRKEEQVAEARARSDGEATRRKISSQSSSRRPFSCWGGAAASGLGRIGCFGDAAIPSSRDPPPGEEGDQS